MMKIFYQKKILILFVLISLFFIGLKSVYAQDVYDIVSGWQDETAGAAGYTEAGDPVELAGTVVQSLLSFLGVVFLILMIYAGFIYMMARGNDAEAAKARDIMINATMGLAVVFGGYAISSYVITRLVGVVAG